MRRTFICLGIAALLFCFNRVTAVSTVRQTNSKESPKIEKFKVKTQLVEVRAVVTDRHNKIIENLQKEDFELLDNKRPQEISVFSHEGIKGEPVRSVTSARVAQSKPVETKSAGEQLRETPSRSTLLYVDNLHLSFSNLNRAKQALSGFVEEHMTGRDMVAIAASSGTLGIAQQFTQDRQLLRYGIERIGLGRIKRSTHFTHTIASDILAEWPMAMFLAINIMKSEDGIDGDYRMLINLARSRATEIVSEAIYLRRATLLPLRDYAKQMMGLPGQRIIIILSEGFSLRESLGGPHMEEVQAVIDRAVHSDIQIYVIDLNSLQASPTNDVSIPLPNDSTSVPLLHWYDGKASAEKLHGMFALANDTGGRVFQTCSNPNDALDQVLDANRSYYLLGFYLPSDSDLQGSRTIMVRVRNHPEYIVKARRRFFPSDLTKANENEIDKTPQQQLIQAVNAPLPQTDLGVSVLADFMGAESDDKQVSLKVHLEGSKLQYRAVNSNHALGLEILYRILDSEGKQADAQTANIDVTLTPERLIQAQTNGYVFAQRLALKPGVYQARIGIREKETGHIGTAATWIEVPDLARSRLEISSLILAIPSLEKPAVAEGFSINDLSHGKMMYGTHLYAQGDTLGYFFRIFHGTKDSSDSRTLFKKEFYQGGMLINKEDWLPIPPDEMHTDSKEWSDVSGKMNLSAFSPGIYEMRITVSDSRSKSTVWRSAVFGVE